MKWFSRGEMFGRFKTEKNVGSVRQCAEPGAGAGRRADGGRFPLGDGNGLWRMTAAPRRPAGKRCESSRFPQAVNM